MVDFLIYRDALLLVATMDGGVLLFMFKDVESIEALTINTRQVLRNKCMYLTKAYEVALQNMKERTWSESCAMEIEELQD